MAKRYCELCQRNYATEMRGGVELCSDCADSYHKALTGELSHVKRFFSPEQYANATDLAKSRIIIPVRQKYKQNQIAKEAERSAKEAERKRQEFAKSFNEFYEYDVVTIINKNHGTVDKQHMMEVLANHASQGWRLHSIYSNELGKNALSVLGLGVNSTACEDVLIFERRVEKV